MTCTSGLKRDSIGMQEAAHEHFGLGVFALDAAHVVGAGLFAVDVGHVR